MARRSLRRFPAATFKLAHYPPRCVLVLSPPSAVAWRMTDAPDRLTPAAPDELADALAFALRFGGRKRVHKGDEIMAAIVAKRLVEHLERTGFVFIRKPPSVGAAAAKSW